MVVEELKNKILNGEAPLSDFDTKSIGPEALAKTKKCWQNMQYNSRRNRSGKDAQ